MVFQEWGQAIVFALQNILVGVASFIPGFVGALIVFLVGLAIAVSFGKAFEKAGVKIDVGSFAGGLVRWFLIIVFLLVASNILGLSQVAGFLQSVLQYLPHVFVAAVILIFAAFFADFAERSLRGMVGALGSHSSLIGVMARWAIWAFAFVAVLDQLGIARELIQTLITGLVGAIALALGLSFGLGGRDTAAAILDKVRKEIEK